MELRPTKKEEIVIEGVHICLRGKHENKRDVRLNVELRKKHKLYWNV
jgi:hypothetical protein